MDIIHIHKNLSTIHGYLPGCIHGSPYAWPALNDVGLTRELVNGRVSARRNSDWRSKRQETFIHSVAGAIGAPARRRPLQTSENVEEICSSIRNVSKQWAALATLPPEVQANHLPGSRAWTSLTTCQHLS
jgi:hypothetical protein